MIYLNPIPRCLLAISDTCWTGDLSSSAEEWLEPPYTSGLGMYDLDCNYYLVAYVHPLFQNWVSMSVCIISRASYASDPNILLYFEFYLHVFKVQNCWPFSAVVAKRGMIAVLWMTMHLHQIFKILNSSFKDWRTV